MNDASPTSGQRIAVIGGGIAGLAEAHRLLELDPAIDVTLFEASDRLGGVLQTSRPDGYLVEHSADSFITNLPWAVQLAERVGLADQLLPTDDAFRRAFVVRRGKLHPVPVGFQLMVPRQIMPLVRSPLLSPLGKLRVLGEAVTRRRRASGDESLEQFATRRLGREAFERLVQPLVGGIYTADPAKLSMAATFPQLLEMERNQGGLIRGAWRQARRASNTNNAADDGGARYSLFVAPRNGMGSLAAAVADRLPSDWIRRDTHVEQLERSAQTGLWTIHLATAPPQAFAGVIIATRATQAAHLLKPADARLTAELAAIEYAGSSVVVLGYHRDQIRHALDGFGFVVPAIERRRIIAGSFTSVKFPGRAPEGRVLLRVFVGGALQPELATLPDDAMIALVRSELQELLGADGEPELVEVHRWLGAMPQYHVGHVERIAAIERLVGEIPGLELAGNAYRGVGVPQCIRSGELAAQRLLESRQADD